MRINNAYKLNISLLEFNKIRDILDEKMYRDLKQKINNIFVSVDSFNDLMNDDFINILDDVKVRIRIKNISNSPLVILYKHETGDFIQFFNFERYYEDIIKTLSDNEYISEFNYNGEPEYEYREIVWNDIFDSGKRIPVDAGFIVNILSENVISKLVEYLYRKYYELSNQDKKENPEN